MPGPVERWLETFMCKQYAETFEAYGFKTLQSVCQLQLPQLQAMGVAQEHCEKILENVYVLRQTILAGNHKGSGQLPERRANFDPSINSASSALRSVAMNANYHRGNMNHYPDEYGNYSPGGQAAPATDGRMSGMNYPPGRYEDNMAMMAQRMQGYSQMQGYVNQVPTQAQMMMQQQQQQQQQQAQQQMMNRANGSGMYQNQQQQHYMAQQQQQQQQQQHPQQHPQQQHSQQHPQQQHPQQQQQFSSTGNYPGQYNMASGPPAPSQQSPQGQMAGAGAGAGAGYYGNTNANAQQQSPMHHHARMSAASQNPQQVADSILHIASNYPQQQTVQVPLQKNRSAPYHVPRSPHYMQSSGSPNQSPMGTGGMNRHMSYPSPQQQQQSRTSPISPMLMQSPVSHQSNQSLPSPSSMHSPSGIRSPIPTPPPGYGNVGGLRSPCDMQQMTSTMGGCQPMRSPVHMAQMGSPANRSCSSANITSPGQHQQHFSPNPLNSPSSHVSSPYTPSSKGHISSPPQSQTYQTVPSSTSPSPYISDMSPPDPAQQCAMGPANPLQSLQKLVMLPETQVVDPKSVVNDACMPSPQSNEGSKNCDGSVELPSGEASGKTTECSNSNSADQSGRSQSPPCTDGKHCEESVSDVKNQSDISQDPAPQNGIDEPCPSASSTTCTQAEKTLKENCDSQKIPTDLNDQSVVKPSVGVESNSEIPKSKVNDTIVKNTLEKSATSELTTIKPKLVNGDIDHDSAESQKLNHILVKKSENHKKVESQDVSVNKPTDSIKRKRKLSGVSEGRKRQKHSNSKKTLDDGICNDSVNKCNDPIENLRVRKDSGNTYSKHTAFPQTEDTFSDFDKDVLSTPSPENLKSMNIIPSSSINCKQNSLTVLPSSRDNLPSKPSKETHENKKLGSVLNHVDSKDSEFKNREESSTIGNEGSKVSAKCNDEKNVPLQSVDNSTESIVSSDNEKVTVKTAMDNSEQSEKCKGATDVPVSDEQCHEVKLKSEVKQEASLPDVIDLGDDVVSVSDDSDDEPLLAVLQKLKTPVKEADTKDLFKIKEDDLHDADPDPRVKIEGESPSSEKKKRGRPFGSKNRMSDKEREKIGRKKKKRNKEHVEVDPFTDMKFSKTLESMKKKKKDSAFSSGPFIRVEGPKTCATSVKVFNQTPTEDLDPKLIKKKANNNRTSALSMQISNLPSEKSKMLPSQKLTPEVTWVCALCGKHSSFKNLGDLFGPYYVESHLALLKTQEETKKEELAKIVTPEPKAPESSGGNKRTRRRRSSEKRSSLGSRVAEPPAPTPKEVWVHEDCAMWNDGVFLIGSKIYGLEEAIKVAGSSVCSCCRENGAMVGCLHKGCNQKYHFLCATEKGCLLDEERFTLLCPKHKEKWIKIEQTSAKS